MAGKRNLGSGTGGGGAGQAGQTQQAVIPGHPGTGTGAGGFRCCPVCGGPNIRFENAKHWLCPDCGFDFFHNVAAAAGVIIDCAGRVLFVERAKEPRKGFLALPGGFVDPGERAEDGAIRECREEIGWAPERIEFLASFPNVYEYKGFSYHTCDFYFYTRSPIEFAGELIPQEDETTSVRLIDLDLVPLDGLAFPSLRKAIMAYRELVNASPVRE